MWYRTMTAILLRRERGRNKAEKYAVLVVTPPPPPLQREVTFQKGGCNDARVRYIHVYMYVHVPIYHSLLMSFDLLDVMRSFSLLKNLINNSLGH